MWSSTRCSAPSLAHRTAACALALVGLAAASASEDSPEPPAPVPAYLDHVRPLGEGRLRWFGLALYDARLFVAPDFDARDPTASRLVLELTYARRLAGRSIADASRDELERLGFGSAADRARWHESMLRIFPDVDTGRRIAGVNLPGRGARFYFDGRFIGAIDDPQFARGFFAIWLDPRTRAPALRAALLGRVERQDGR